MFWKLFKKKTIPIESTASSHQSSTQTDNQLTLSLLQKLIPIGELAPQDLLALPCLFRRFAAGEIIFNRGERAEELMYLYSGEIFLETANGSGVSIEASLFRACYPLSSQNEHHFTAIAKSAATIIYFPLSVMQRSADIMEHHNPLTDIKLTPIRLQNSQLFKSFCEAYNQERLQIPSLPDVAIRLRSALQKNIDIGNAVKIINLDPAIAAKLVQVANSNLYRINQPFASCHDAVNRLGLQTTQNLVTSMSLKNLFRSDNRLLNTCIQRIWKQSIQIASLSYILATLSRKQNADEALLAGLVHNIGALPIIAHAESLDSETYTEQELMETITTLQSQVGEYILSKWHFPANLLKIPKQTSYWYHDAQPSLQLSDIVLLARFHSQLGTPQAQALPPINTLPAFSKLGEYSLTPDMSLQILQDAKQQIAEALNFFRG